MTKVPKKAAPSKGARVAKNTAPSKGPRVAPARRPQPARGARSSAKSPVPTVTAKGAAAVAPPDARAAARIRQELRDLTRRRGATTAELASFDQIESKLAELAKMADPHASLGPVIALGSEVLEPEPGRLLTSEPEEQVDDDVEKISAAAHRLTERARRADPRSPWLEATSSIVHALVETLRFSRSADLATELDEPYAWARSVLRGGVERNGWIRSPSFAYLPVENRFGKLNKFSVAGGFTRLVKAILYMRTPAPMLDSFYADSRDERARYIASCMAFNFPGVRTLNEGNDASRQESIFRRIRDHVDDNIEPSELAKTLILPELKSSGWRQDQIRDAMKFLEMRQSRDDGKPY